MVSIPRLKQSFCGCTLETSSLILAWLGVLGVAFQLLLGACWFALFYDHTRDEMKKNHMAEEKVEEIMLSLRVGAAVAFVIYSASLAINTMLLVGVYKRNHCLMTPYIIFNGIGCVLGMLAVLMSVIASFANPTMFVVALVQGLCVALAVYCFLLVYSYYAQLKEEKIMNDSRFKQLDA